MSKEPVRRYLVVTAKMAGVNCLVLFVVALFLPLGATASYPHTFSMFGFILRDGTEGPLMMLWICLAVSFFEGFYVRRTLSAVTVPASWAITGWPILLDLPVEAHPVLSVIPLLVIPALTALSARQGSRYGERRRLSDVLWLPAMLVVVFLLIIHNRELFGLVPDQLRWRIWNCPL